jgi:hypothetical protein
MPVNQFTHDVQLSGVGGCFADDVLDDLADRLGRAKERGPRLRCVGDVNRFEDGVAFTCRR